MDDKALTNLFEVFGSDTDLREIHLFLKADSEKFKAQSKDFRIEIGQVFVDNVPLPFIILNFRYEEKHGRPDLSNPIATTALAFYFINVRIITHHHRLSNEVLTGSAVVFTIGKLGP